MKHTRRFLSVLLAAALVVQSGVIAAMADTTPACGQADHGKTTPVASVGGCTGDTHWIKPVGNTLVAGGNNGTNYFYVDSGNSVACGGTKNVIVAKNVFNGEVTIANFDTNTDKIIVLGTPVTPTIGDGEITITDSSSYAGVFKVTVKPGSAVPTEANVVMKPANNVVKPVITKNPEATYTVEKGQLLNLEIKVNDTSTGVWEKLENGSVWTSLGKGTNVSGGSSIEVDTTTAGETKYRYSMLDEIGGVVNSQAATVTVTACEMTASLDAISRIAQSYSPEANQEIALPNLLKFGDPTLCNVSSHGNHGYSVEWTVGSTENGPNVSGVAIADGKLKLTAAALPEAETPVKLTATLKKGSETKDTMTFDFKVKKFVAPSCTATATLTAITNPVDLINGDQQTIVCTSNFAVSGTGCTLPEHQGDPFHGYSVKWTFTPDNGNISGVTFSGDTFTINKSQLPAAQTKGSLSAEVQRNGASTRAATVNKYVYFQQTGVCQTKPTSITLNTTTASQHIALADFGTEKKFTPFTVKEIKWDNGTCNAYTNNNHAAVTWSINNVNGVKIDAATGEMTITGNNLPSPSNTINVTAAITANGETKTATAVYTVTRDKKCDYSVDTIAVVGKSPITLSTTGTVSETYTAKREYKGSVCEFGDAHKNSHGENVTWSIANGTYNKSLPSGGFSIDNNGKLSITGRYLTVGTPYDVIIRAEAGGKYMDATITVTRTRSSSSSDDDNDNSDSQEWESFREDIVDARSGETLKIDLGGNTEMPYYIFDKIRGKNITLKMSVTGGYTWTVNGKTAKKLPAYQIYIPLDVEKYSNSKMLRLCRDYDVKSFQLRHDGSFYADMKLTMDVGSDYAKKTLYLYSYNEDNNKLAYSSSAKADEDGDVTFTMTKSLGAYVVTSKALYGESAVSGGGGSVGSGGSPSTVYPPTTTTPTAPPASSSTSSSSSSSSSSESSSESSEPAPPEEPSSEEESKPTDGEPDKEEKKGIPVLVPILILAIAGVITATVLIVRSSGKGGSEDDFDD